MTRSRVLHVDWLSPVLKVIAEAGTAEGALDLLDSTAAFD
jgi:hypothetical protein